MFRTGHDINPFSAGAREGIKILESITPSEFANCVPRIIITKIDFKTGKPIEDKSKSLVFDMIKQPDFNNQFGLDNDSFIERSLVSLQSLTVKSELQYGIDSLRQINLKFIVHKPEIVFDRDTKIAWHEILEEGKSFSLEYGWSADYSVCKNDLFNGFGHVTNQGIVIKSVSVLLLIVSKWTASLKANGEVEINITAFENGDIALREARFSDVSSNALSIDKLDDGAKSLFVKLKNLTKFTTVAKKGKFIKFIDLLNEIVSPLLGETVKMFGYKGSPPLILNLANFNINACKQSDSWGGQNVSNSSIGEFILPYEQLIEALTKHLAIGKSMLLRNFLNIIFKLVNSDEAWNYIRGNQIRPNIGVLYNTIKSKNGGITLVVTILDRNAIGDNVKKLSILSLEKQTRNDVFKALNDADVPIIEFKRGGSVIIDANFEAQPDPLLQSIQMETAESIRKDKVQKNKIPDVDSRVGQARPRDIVPISSLSGDIVMLGNFVIGPFDRVWVDFYGSSQISGIFNVLEKTDTLEVGKFISSFRVISESIDPLNTRKKFDDLELKSINKK